MFEITLTFSDRYCAGYTHTAHHRTPLAHLVRCSFLRSTGLLAAASFCSFTMASSSNAWNSIDALEIDDEDEDDFNSFALHHVVQAPRSVVEQTHTSLSASEPSSSAAALALSRPTSAVLSSATHPHRLVPLHSHSTNSLAWVHFMYEVDELRTPLEFDIRTTVSDLHAAQQGSPFFSCGSRPSVFSLLQCPHDKPFLAVCIVSLDREAAVDAFSDLPCRHR